MRLLATMAVLIFTWAANAQYAVNDLCNQALTGTTTTIVTKEVIASPPVIETAYLQPAFYAPSRFFFGGYSHFNGYGGNAFNGYGGNVQINNFRSTFRPGVQVNNFAPPPVFAGGGGFGGGIAGIIRAIGDVANSPAGGFALGALAAGGKFGGVGPKPFVVPGGPGVTPAAAAAFNASQGFRPRAVARPGGRGK